MKQEKIDQASAEKNEMRPEYDFTDVKGVRRKYYQAYQQGHTVKIQQEDGTVTTQYFTRSRRMGGDWALSSGLGP